MSIKLKSSLSIAMGLAMLALWTATFGAQYQSKPANSTNKNTSTNLKSVKRERPTAKKKDANVRNLQIAKAKVNDRVVYRNKNILSILNGPADKSQLIELNSVEGLELDLRINVIGRWHTDRITHILVAVYERPGDSPYRVGRLITIQKELQPVLTTRGEEKEFSKHISIPLLQGEYIFKIFVCDEKEIFEKGLNHASFPDPIFFPGAINTTTTGVVHVF